MNWQPIETAPKDSKTVLLATKDRYGNKHIVTAHWAHGGGEDQPRFGPAWFYWCGEGFAELRRKPTHWMPLPEPPQ